jgi:GntR family transcriptional regulator
MMETNIKKRALDPDSIVPLYYQLKEILREDIAAGVWKAGDTFPSEAELCVQYDVSRATVRQAIGDLVKERLLHRRQGRGTFVAEPKLQEDLLGFFSFSAEMTAKGHTVQSEVLSVDLVSPSAGLRLLFKLSPDEEVNQIVRLRRVDGEPLFLEKTSIPRKLASRLLEKDLSSNPIFLRLLTEEYGIRPHSVKKAIEPALADQYEAQVLGIQVHAPVLILERTAYDISGAPVVFTKWVVRGDRCKHYIDPSAP